MANKRHKPEEIVQKLRQVDVLVGHPGRKAVATRGAESANQTTKEEAALAD